MKIILKGFRAVAQAEYTIQNEQLTLIKGASGIGKSTIFCAITWCLYGTLRGVDPKDGSTGKLSVTIITDNMTIYRQKRPNLLKVIDLSGEYQSEAAQAIIDKLYGNKDMWRSISYIAQGERNGLLISSNKEKMDLLTQLAFCGEDPDQYVDKIDSALKAAQNDYNISKALYEKEVLSFTESMKHDNIVATDYCDNLTKLQEQIKTYQAEMVTLEQKCIEHERVDAQVEFLKANLSKVNLQLQDLATKYQGVIPNESEIITLERNIKECQDLTQAKKYQSELLLLQKDVVPTSLNKEECTEKRVYQLQSEEQEYSKAVQICQALKIEYSQSAIEKQIANLQIVLDGQTQYKLLKECNDKQEQLKEKKKLLLALQEGGLEKLIADIAKPTPLVQPEENKEDLFALQGQLHQAQIRSKLHKCPKCNVCLKFDGVKLDPTDEVLVTMEEVRQLEQRIIKARNSQELSSKYEKEVAESKQRYDNKVVECKRNYEMQVAQLTQSVQFLSEEIKKAQILLNGEGEKVMELTEKQTVECKRRIEILRSLKVITPSTIKWQEVKAGVDYYAVLEKINSVQEKLVPYKYSLQLEEQLSGIDSRGLTNKITTLRNDRQLYLQCQAELSNTQQMLDRVISLLQPQVKEQLVKHKQELSALQYKLERGNKYNRLMILREQLVQLQTSTLSKFKRHNLLERLKESTVLAQNKLLQDTVDAVNNSLIDIGNKFFDSPISIKLQLYKTLKSDTSRIKPQVNMIILYKGNEYDSIDQLSGGEGDRVSLALTIALNSISGSPLLLLDECMSSLDQDLREICLERLKSVGNRTVIAIDHDGVEGHFDNTITITA